MTIPLREEPTGAPAGDPGFWFDEAAARRACDFFPRFLRFTKDKWAGKPFALEPWQERDIVAPLFGWKRADGRRRYRRAIVFLPRKNGKTELAAGLSLLMLMGDGLHGAEVYALASTEAQARIMFDKAAAMVGMSPALLDVAQITTKSIYCQRFDSFIRPLDGRAKGKHGLNASGLVADELHEWRSGDLYTTVHQSEAAREQPLEVMISTAGVRDKNYGWEIWQEAEKLRTGQVVDDETLVVIYAADQDDDWTAEATWAKANPNLGVSVSLDYLRAECRKAQGNPRLENDFRRYHLNQWTGQALRWLPLARWDACRTHRPDWRDETGLTGRRCFVGLDLSSTNDLTALAYAFPPREPGAPWERLYRVFIPEGRVEERQKQAGVPLDRWISTGALRTTPGDTIDYEFVLATLLDDAARFDIEKIGFDPWNSTAFTNRAVDLGVPFEKFAAVRQGFSSLSAPSKAYDKLVTDGDLGHAGHPVLRWMADNVSIALDPAGNIKPAKNKSAEKIDGIVADIIAQAVALEPETPSGVGIF